MRKSLFALFLILTVAVRVGFAQGAKTETRPLPNPAVRINREDASSFAVLLSTLSAQAHIAVVAEGVPLHPHPSEKEILNLCRNEAPLTVAMQEIANVFDYDMERQGAVFLFRKRYSETADLPSLTYAECLFVAKEINRITRDFDLPHPVPDSLAPLFRSFSDDQLKRMAREGVPVSEMNPTQRSLVLAKIQEVCYGRMPYYGFLIALQDIRGNEPYLRYQDASTYHYKDAPTPLPVLGYSTTRFQAGEDNVFLPLSSLNIFYVVDMSVTMFPVFDAKGISKPDPTSWTAQDVEDWRERHHQPGAMTLSSAVAMLNKPNQTLFAVDEPFQDKEVTVIGARQVEPDNLFAALGEIYNYEIHPGKDGSKVLTKKHYPVLQSFTDMKAAVADLNPASAVRALAAAKKRNLVILRDKDVVKYGADSMARISDAVYDYSADHSGEAEVRAQIAKRIRMLVQPSVDRSPYKRVHIADLEPAVADEVRNLLAASHMLGTERELLQAAEMSEWRPLVDFEHVVLVGARYNEPKRGAASYIKYLVRKPDGKLYEYGSTNSTPPRN